jgi:hypothetical protein
VPSLPVRNSLPPILLLTEYSILSSQYSLQPQESRPNHSRTTFHRKRTISAVRVNP